MPEDMRRETPANPAGIGIIAPEYAVPFRPSWRQWKSMRAGKDKKTNPCKLFRLVRTLDPA